MSEDDTNKNKTISFRVSEEVHDDLSQLDRGMSELYRGMTELCLQDPFFADGVNTYIEGEVDSFEEYAEAYFEASAEVYAEDLAEEYERPVDAAELKEPLMDYVMNASIGYRTGAKKSVEGIKEVDEVIGHVFEAANKKFSEDHWDETLE